MCTLLPGYYATNKKHVRDICIWVSLHPEGSWWIILKLENLNENGQSIKLQCCFATWFICRSMWKVSLKIYGGTLVMRWSIFDSATCIFWIYIDIYIFIYFIFLQHLRTEFYRFIWVCTNDDINQFWILSLVFPVIIR